MKRWPGKGVGTVEFRDIGTVQLTHGGDERPRGEGARGAVGRPQPNGPDSVVIVPLGPQGFGIPLDMPTQIVRVDRLCEIVLQLPLFGEEMRPIVVGFKAVAVEMVGYINTRAGIAVFQVSPLPAAASNSFSVVDTMIDAGNPLCCPSSPDANTARNAALNPSC